MRVCSQGSVVFVTLKAPQPCEVSTASCMEAVQCDLLGVASQSTVIWSHHLHPCLLQLSLQVTREVFSVADWPMSQPLRPRQECTELSGKWEVTALRGE